MEAKEALEIYFEYDDFKPGQEEIMDDGTYSDDILMIFPLKEGGANDQITDG